MNPRFPTPDAPTLPATLALIRQSFAALPGAPSARLTMARLCCMLTGGAGRDRLLRLIRAAFADMDGSRKITPFPAHGFRQTGAATHPGFTRLTSLIFSKEVSG